ncbi:MAG: Gfo/Idh/MocA family oxidoreductase [Spirochaetes bacterium]|nr:Gfo/Idh/MocA family oxidoreductase [Spirochaetota bacterium]
MAKLKIGIIGVGHMGQYHLNIFSNLPEVAIAGIYDTNEERLLDLGNRYGVPAFDNYKKLIKKCDALCIASPTVTHFEIARDTLMGTKHVLLEKPMTTTLEEAKDLVNIAKKKKVIFQVGHVERFNGAVQQLKNIIFNPFYIETKRLGPFQVRSSDVSVVLDLMIHDIDILLNLVEDEVVEISAVGRPVYSKFEDISVAQIRFAGGCFATVMASRASQKKVRNLSVMQKDSFVFLDYSTQDIEIHRQASTAYLLTPEEIRYSQESFVEHLQVHKDNPLKLELLHFINCIYHKEEPIVDNKQDLLTLELSLKIIEQINKKLRK